jgi:hypothetical protein
MIVRAPLLSLMILAAGFSGGGWALRAQVATKSPFLPTGGAGAPTAAPTGATLEFRAYMDVGSGLQFRLFDPAKKTGVWVKLNERNAEFDVTAKQHDEAQKTLTIEHQGRTLTLALREAKVVSAGSAGMIPPTPAIPAPPPTPNVSPAVTQTVVLNPTPADEQRRLEAVAAEVARRRALREQAAQQMSQGAPPLPPGPAPGRPPGTPPAQAR